MLFEYKYIYYILSSFLWKGREFVCNSSTYCMSLITTWQPNWWTCSSKYLVILFAVILVSDSGAQGEKQHKWGCVRLCVEAIRAVVFEVGLADGLLLHYGELTPVPLGLLSLLGFSHGCRWCLVSPHSLVASQAAISYRAIGKHPTWQGQPLQNR